MPAHHELTAVRHLRRLVESARGSDSRLIHTTRVPHLRQRPEFSFEEGSSCATLFSISAPICVTMNRRCSVCARRASRASRGSCTHAAQCRTLCALAACGQRRRGTGAYAGRGRSARCAPLSFLNQRTLSISPARRARATARPPGRRPVPAYRRWYRCGSPGLPAARKASRCR